MLNQRWARLATDMLELYEELDREVAGFAAQSGMRCVSGCGACCLSPHVETTVAEMLPLALRLFENGEVEAVMERLQSDASLCVQYESLPGQAGKGRCRSYAQRPVICRLFGFTGSRDKAGQPRYRACRILQQVEAERIQAVDAELKSGRLAIPWLAPAHERVVEIGESLGVDILPINRALLKAIEIVGLSLQLTDHEESQAC